MMNENLFQAFKEYIEAKIEYEINDREIKTDLGYDCPVTINSKRLVKAMADLERTLNELEKE